MSHAGALVGQLSPETDAADDRLARRPKPRVPRGRAAAAVSIAAADRVSVYTSFDECEAVWRRVEGYCSGSLFQCFEWQSTWQRTIGAANAVKPYIAVVSAPSGRVLLVLPLGIYRHRGLRVLRFLGDVVTDYNLPLIEREFAAEIGAADIAELWSAILSKLPRVDLIWLWRMPPSFGGVANPLIGLPGAAHTENSFAALLPADMAEFRRAHSVDWPDTRRRLAERGQVEFSIATEPSEKREVFESLVTQKSRRWRETGARDLFARPEYVAFYRALTDMALPYGEVQLAALRVDSQVVAAHWGIVHADRFYYLIPAFDAEWSAYSVGRLLLEDVVAWCIRETDLRVFDMTVGAEPYKRDWTDHAMPLYGLIAASSPMGRLFVVQRSAREWLKRHNGLRNFVRRLRGQRPKPDECRCMSTASRRGR